MELLAIDFYWDNFLRGDLSLIPWLSLSQLKCVCIASRIHSLRNHYVKQMVFFIYILILPIFSKCRTAKTSSFNLNSLPEKDPY